MVLSYHARDFNCLNHTSHELLIISSKALSLRQHLILTSYKVETRKAVLSISSACFTLVCTMYRDVEGVKTNEAVQSISSSRIHDVSVRSVQDMVLDSGQCSTSKIIF